MTDGDTDATATESGDPAEGDPRVAVFRPDDGRLEAALKRVREFDMQAIGDPMLAVEPTDEEPRTDAEFVIFTSRTGVRIADQRGWHQTGASVCAIGESTADALHSVGVAVDVIPDEFSSAGLVEALGDNVDGARVEVARSDHGSQTLLDGLEAAGAYVHETVLYRLTRPPESGRAAVLAAAGDLDAALFTSSLTVEHLLAAADERGIRERTITGLNTAVIGVIGEPTRRTAGDNDIAVDVVASVADFDVLLRETAAALRDGGRP